MSESRFDFVALRRLLVLLSLPLVALVLTGLVGARDGRSPDATLRELRIFSEVLQLTGRNYVDEIDFRQLERGAYRGLAESLDPWSSLYDPQRLAELQADDKGADVGLLLIKHPQQYVRVVVVIPGSPAAVAGVKRGQFIETIDSRETKDIPLLEAVAMLAGSEGSVVKLGFFRSGDDEEGKVVDLARRELSALRLTEERLDPTSAMLRLTDLRAGMADMVAARLASLREAGISDLVLDLRENVGGSADEAIRVADLLAPAGGAFQRVTRQGSTVAATKDENAWEGRLAVLVSRGTVGEAELLAETLRVLRSAPLVGQPTLGKTTQQDLVRLSSGLGLSLSVVEYRRPDGTKFPDDGLQPDEKVARIASVAPAAASGATGATAPRGPRPVDDPAAAAERAADAADASDAADAADAEGGAVAPADDAQLKRALELLRAAPAAPAAAVAVPRKAA